MNPEPVILYSYITETNNKIITFETLIEKSTIKSAAYI